MTEQHPITPPPELVQEWIAQPACQDYFSTAEEVAIAAARWGADQELEACCQWLGCYSAAEVDARDLRLARRPKPLSLAEQASASLDEVVRCLKMLVPGASVDGVHIETVRAALERLQEVEGNG